ncbi:MAG: tetratricopeptide repeat protein [Stigonema ocellatum SAG 48.90 = DSM 106950]|nr:tetratricopeptide repeat protein [Stigonema ocellatum SAG 48.90 = DSM 106950]
MKGLKLAVAILALGTIAISPKADAKSLVNTRQILTSQVTAQVPNSENEKTNDAKTYLERGLARIEKKNYRGAIEDFNQVLNREPNNAYAYVGRGLASFSLEQYQAAKTDFDKALEITPNIAYAHFFRGFTNYILKDKPGAIADLQKASTLFKKEGNQEFAQKADSAIQKIQES